MLAGGLDGLYREGLAGSHRTISRIEVWREGVRIDGFGEDGVPFVGGQVQATLRSRVTRNLNLTVHEDLVPYLDDEDGLLTPYGNYVRCVRGIELGSGQAYEWSTFYGKIAETDDTGDGSVEIAAADRADEVIRANFPAPRSSTIGTSVRSQVMELIEDAVPDAQFSIDPLVASQLVPGLTWEYDRGRGLDELATAAGTLWWALPSGLFTLRPVPWATYAPPAVTLTEVGPGSIVHKVGPGSIVHKVGPGSIVHKARGKISNETVINDVVGYGERLDGTTPVWARATNNNPTSPTRANGPIGRRSRLVRLQTPTSQGSIQRAVEDYLRRGAGLAEEWSWTQTVDPAMELGEVVLLAPKRRTTPVVQVVSSYTIPLNVEVAMSVTGRAMVIGLGDESDI